MKKSIKILLVTLALLFVLPVAVSAAAPYTTYTYSSTGFVLHSPDAYVPDEVVDADYIGPDRSGNSITIEDPRDLEVDEDGNVYIVDGTQNAIYVLDRYYRNSFTINSFINEQGVPDTFSGVSGVFITSDFIYACDTENSRIVIFDREGNFVKTVGQPESSLIEDDAIYRPVAVAVDEYGRMFVVSSTTYEGIIVMGDNEEFYGYIGAQRVSLSPWEAFWRNLGINDDETMVSTEYNNITIDEDNFLYVTASSPDEDAEQSSVVPVKKLNVSGTDIMRRNGFFDPIGEVKVSTDETSAIRGASVIIDAAVGPEGTWSIIDEKRSKVFTYDSDGNLLFAFGDSGNQTGSIASIEAVVYQDDKMLLLDKENNSFTVYRRTEYGDILINALKNQNERNNEAEISDWEEILKRNNNFDVAYVGIASALYQQGNYEEAMEYYRAAYDSSGYSDSYGEIRKEWISNFFLIIPVVVIVIAVLVVKFFGYAAKRNRIVALKVGQKNIREELLYAFHVIFHPFDGFWDLKHEKRGSVRSAFVILVITVLAFFYQTVGTGYIFGGEDANTANIFMTLLSVLVPLLLWVIANWCLTTLFDGEGSFSDVFVASCYALLPLPLLIIPSTLLSNVLVAEEGTFITMINTVAFFWAGILLFFGMMITHDYSFGKSVVITVVTIVGMIFIMFIAVLFSTLITRMVSFVLSIVNEVQYRV
ncbi:MAG: YIP1 family protein [Clostridiales bacterium]|nr:YIP1 family protein [Clostridiales bacterium]